MPRGRREQAHRWPGHRKTPRPRARRSTPPQLPASPAGRPRTRARRLQGRASSECAQEARGRSSGGGQCRWAGRRYRSSVRAKTRACTSTAPSSTGLEEEVFNGLPSKWPIACPSIPSAAARQWAQPARDKAVGREAFSRPFPEAAEGFFGRAGAGLSLSGSSIHAVVAGQCLSARRTGSPCLAWRPGSTILTRASSKAARWVGLSAR